MKTIEEIRKAFNSIHRRACGDTNEVYMSIPARPEHDADLILSAAIDELECLREGESELESEFVERGIKLRRQTVELDALRTQLAQTREALEAIARIARTPPQSVADQAIVEVCEKALRNAGKGGATI